MRFLSAYIVIPVILFLIAGCKCGDRNAPDPIENTENIGVAPPKRDISAPRVDEDGNFIYEVGPDTDIRLPDGLVIKAGEFTAEKKLFSMLDDNDFQISEDKTIGWVTLDRIYFSSGSANLSESSAAQIDNLISLLHAFPESKVKLGGYTDNSGDEESNLKISENRAKAAADELLAGGIAEDRISYEGYGETHFVCPENDTEECRAQNRRVDLRITKK